MKYFLLLGVIGSVMYGAKKFNDKIMCLDPEDFEKWLKLKRVNDPSIDQKYQAYLVYAEKMKKSDWKVVPFVLYYEGSK